MPQRKHTSFYEEEVVYDDEDTSHLGSSAVGSSAQRQRGSVHYTQDIRMRVRTSSSRSRSTSVQRLEAEEERAPSGEYSVPNLPPRSRLRQTATNGRVGKGRGGRDDEEERKTFTGFDELDAIAAAKPQEESSKGRASPTITRSNTALPRKKRAREGSIPKEAEVDTVKISVAAEDLPLDQDEYISNRWDTIQPEPAPRLKRSESDKLTIKNASKNQFVPLSLLALTIRSFSMVTS